MLRRAQLVFDYRRELRKPRRECSQQAEASGEYRVAVRPREVRLEGRAVEQTAARTGDRQLFWRRRVDAQLQRPVPHVVENLVVGERAGPERLEVACQFRAGQLAGVMLEEAGDASFVKQRGNGVEVANVDDGHRVGCRNDRIIERTE